MTSLADSVSPFPDDCSPTPEPPTSSLGWRAVEVAAEMASERLNPILVKESRQALKSKQFVVTFSLLLLAGWVWSILGVAILWPGIYYAPGGRFMLSIYLVILAIPVLVIVPFSAFRSLAAEREDGTFELLSITALSARQIVTGKLGSAMLQMLVYFSALAPCIAFTYLLRGIDIITIGFLLFYTCVASMMLSAFGLVIATISRTRHWQVLLSVLLLIMLCLVTFIWTMLFIQIIAAQDSAFDHPDFWLVQGVIVTFCVSNAALFVLIAAAQISFASDNRSTPLRIMLLLQQVLWVGWMTYLWMHFKDDDVLYVLVTVAGIYWFVSGALMMGETSQLSPRVKRSLPQSYFGRMAFTWFNPGPGTSYIFCATNLLALVLIVLMTGAAAEITGNAVATGNFNWAIYTSLVGGYVVAYLGTARLLVMMLTLVGRVTTLLTMMLTIFVALMGCAAPWFFQTWLVGYRNMEYSSLQFTNWMWTLNEAVNGGLAMSPFVHITVFVSASFVFLLNLIFAMFEVEQTRQATPDRVQQDDRELQPRQHASFRPKSPWDTL